MKKTTKLLAGAALIASLSTLSACSRTYTVYSPPIIPEQETATVPYETPFAAPTEDPDRSGFGETQVTDPAREMVKVVYGPPPAAYTDEASEW